MESYGHSQADLGSCGIGTVRVYARRNARRSNDRWVVARVTGEGKEVLGGQINAHILKHFAVLWHKGVAQSEVLELHVVTFLQVIRRNHTATALHILIRDRKSTRLNSSHANISYAVFCLKKK